MATADEKRRALLLMVRVDPEASSALLNECGTDAQIRAWLERETRYDAERVAYLAPILREALEDLAR
jgi:hypothetical protein